jgi:predicted RNA-binding Zn-ribbon protein involved in translation (DUF1610 family)
MKIIKARKRVEQNFFCEKCQLGGIYKCQDCDEYLSSKIIYCVNDGEKHLCPECGEEALSKKDRGEQ